MSGFFLMSIGRAPSAANQSEYGGLRRLDSDRKGFLQRIGRDEQPSGEFVGLPFHPAVFDCGNAGREGLFEPIPDQTN